MGRRVEHTDLLQHQHSTRTHITKGFFQDFAVDGALHVAAHILQSGKSIGIAQCERVDQYHQVGNLVAKALLKNVCDIGAEKRMVLKASHFSSNATSPQHSLPRPTLKIEIAHRSRLRQEEIMPVPCSRSRSRSRRSRRAPRTLQRFPQRNGLYVTVDTATGMGSCTGSQQLACRTGNASLGAGGGRRGSGSRSTSDVQSRPSGAGRRAHTHPQFGHCITISITIRGASTTRTGVGFRCRNTRSGGGFETTARRCRSGGLHSGRSRLSRPNLKLKRMGKSYGGCRR